MRAVAFVYRDSKVCLRALTEYTLVLLSLSFRAVCVCTVRLCVQPEMFVKARMFFQWRLQMNIQALSGFGNGNPCASCCHERVRVASGCNVSRHISQHTSRQCILQRAYFDISSSISERKMLSDLLSGEKRGERRYGLFFRLYKVNGRVSRHLDYCMFCEQALAFLQRM